MILNLNAGVSEYFLLSFFWCGVAIVFVWGVVVLDGVCFGILDVLLVKLRAINSSFVSDV